MFSQRRFYVLETMHVFCLASMFFAPDPPGLADEPNKKIEVVSPRISMCIPLAVPTDATSKVIVRGWGLEGIKEIRASNEKLGLKILSSGKASIPNKQDAKQIGDTQVELEVVVPQDVEPGEIELIVVQSNAESQPHALLVGCQHPLRGQAVIEKEPNDGFKQAQPLQFPQTLDGQIDGDGNVDLFSFDLLEKQRIAIEIVASRYGSNLDSILTLYDHRGNIVAVNDDATQANDPKDCRDSKISVFLPAGRYIVSLQDAHDRGGPAHPYRLILRVDKAAQP